MNRWYVKGAILAAVVIAVCICGIWMNRDSLSSGKRQEIKEAWSQFQNRDFTDFVDTDRRSVCGMRYYGTYGGYMILFQPGQLAVLSSETIAGETFTYSSSFTIYAYREGEFRTLAEVHKAGEISKEDIEKIAQKHRGDS